MHEHLRERRNQPITVAPSSRHVSLRVYVWYVWYSEHLSIQTPIISPNREEELKPMSLLIHFLEEELKPMCLLIHFQGLGDRYMQVG